LNKQNENCLTLLSDENKKLFDKIKLLEEKLNNNNNINKNIESNNNNNNSENNNHENNNSLIEIEEVKLIF
jgi:hypothetical protein